MSEREFDPKEHMLHLKGKAYLPVAARVVWFRQDDRCPDWSIETEIYHLDLEAGVAVCRATVRNPAGFVMATATKMETRAGFPDFLEKAETGAVGRALALLGYGTAGALDEGEVVDAPRESQAERRPESQGDRQAGALPMNDTAETCRGCGAPSGRPHTRSCRMVAR